MTQADPEEIRAAVVRRYSALARAAQSGQRVTDSDPGEFTAGCFGSAGYGDISEVPEGAARASLGCGNPVAVADLQPGDVVLDLGSGGGIDVLLSARRVSPGGRAFGLDASPDMVALARENATRAGAGNVQFLRGHIEDIPLPDGQVNVVISNCVLNLSADKPRALAEAFRVLRPGGRLGISDVIASDEADPGQRAEAERLTGCTTGTLTADEYRDLLLAVGFTAIRIRVTHDAGLGVQSAIVQAGRPAAPAGVLIRPMRPADAGQVLSIYQAGLDTGHASFETAALRAVLELCERDAAAMWWLGGCRPKRFALEHPTIKAGAELIERLRQGEAARRTLLLDITTDNGIPVVAAVSVDHDGRGMACGLSSRLTASDAARAAVLEMCQMEMAAPIAEAKRAEGGDALLNDADRRHLRRAEFATADCELLHPRDMSQHATSGPPAALGLKGMIGHLRDRGIRLFLVDHTRQDVGVAVARAVSPDLQPFSAAVSTKRFAQTRRDNEGSDIAGYETPLL